MTYEEALQRIHDRLRFGNKLTLTRIRELLHLLGDPQEDIPIIHIAGTNGKGSVSKFVYNALLAQGYKTGLYTSPYVTDFRERIECCGQWIDQEALTALAKRVLDYVEVMEESGSDPPTEFEVITAMAFQYYKDQQCDYIVAEVGLGGFGDATNVIRNPLLSVITSISYDHMEYLGDTLAEIASEKAGIIKPGRPVVCHVKDEEALEVIREKARACSSAFYSVADHVSNVAIAEMSLGGSRFSMDVFGKTYQDVRIGLAGRFQIDNAATALCALEVLKKECGVALDDEAVRSGLASARHAGRMETLSHMPLTVIDGAHNTDGMRAFCDGVAPFIQGKKTLLTLGMLRDKDLRGMLRIAMELGADLAVSEPDNPRKATAQELHEVLAELGGSAIITGDAKCAYAYAMAHADDYDCFLYAGSLYFISAIREQYRLREDAE